MCKNLHRGGSWLIWNQQLELLTAPRTNLAHHPLSSLQPTCARVPVQLSHSPTKTNGWPLNRRMKPLEAKKGTKTKACSGGIGQIIAIRKY